MPHHRSDDGATLPLLQPAKHRSPRFAVKASPLHSPASSIGSTAASSPSARSRLASEELIVPAVESLSSIYYGVDSFSPTLVDFYTVDQKRIVWSSRAHRKMMTTLYRAWHGQSWKPRSLSFWAALALSTAYTCFLVGFLGEVFARLDAPPRVHALVDAPLLVGALALVVSHALNYFEVINSCHNLEIWLDEYFHGYEPVLQRRFVGVFPSRIDFWTALLGCTGATLLVIARGFVLYRADDGANFGVISVSREDPALIVGYWVPFFVGSFALLLSAYFAHVEVVHRWFSWRLDRLESWVTGLAMLGAIGWFVSSTLQFMDPMAVIFSFPACAAPFAFGCVLGLCSSFLSLLELESIHKRHKHPEYGLLKNPSGYGTWS